MQGAAPERDHHNSAKRKPWHGTAGAPKGPRKRVEEFIADVYDKRRYLKGLRIPVTKRALYDRMGMTRPTFNEYQAGAGAPWPWPPEHHLVFVVDATSRTVVWVSPSLAVAIDRLPDELVGRDVQELALPEPLHWEQAQRLKLGDLTEAMIETCLIHGDGRRIPLEVRVTYGQLFEVWFCDGVVFDQSSHDAADDAEIFY